MALVAPGPEVEYVTNGIPRDGTPRTNSPDGDITDFRSGKSDRVPSPSLTALAFDNVHELMRAAHCLKEQGFDVLGAPRRTAGCGAVVLVASENVSAAAATLAARNITPEETADYPQTGGAT